MLTTTVMFIKAFLVALFVYPILCATIPLQPGRSDTVRIFGGVSAQQDDFSYIVSIQTKSYRRCGGSLKDATTVLSSGHCVKAWKLSKTRI